MRAGESGAVAKVRRKDNAHAHGRSVDTKAK